MAYTYIKKETKMVFLSGPSRSVFYERENSGLLELENVFKKKKMYICNFKISTILIK